MTRTGRLVAGLYKWLPIIMGCHCRPDRSFHYHGRPFPVCARCTGMLLGAGAAACLFWFVPMQKRWMFAMLLPGLLDGLIQLKTSYESNNLRRLWTGALMGYGSTALILCFYRWGYRLGGLLSQMRE